MYIQVYIGFITRFKDRNDFCNFIKFRKDTSFEGSIEYMRKRYCDVENIFFIRELLILSKPVERGA